MEIVLHVGAHRCASSTFQAYLRANRGRLAGRGLTCWTPKRTRDGLFRGLMRHPALISPEGTLRGLTSIEGIRAEVDRLVREQQNTLLISEENLIGSMRNNILDGQLYALLPERLTRIKPALGAGRLKVAFCVRSYEDYWTSCCAYLLGHGAAQPTADLLEHLTNQPRTWQDVIRDIAGVFEGAEITVWPFERIANNPAAQLGHLWEGDRTGLVSNDLWVNRTADLKHLNKTMALRGDAPLRGGAFGVHKRWMPFSGDQRRAMRTQYRRDLAWLNAGADGLARYVDAWPTPATSPDRADVTQTAAAGVAHLKGQTDGIEKGMGSARRG